MIDFLIGFGTASICYMISLHRMDKLHEKEWNKLRNRINEEAENMQSQLAEVKDDVIRYKKRFQ